MIHGGMDCSHGVRDTGIPTSHKLSIYKRMRQMLEYPGKIVLQERARFLQAE